MTPRPHLSPKLHLTATHGFALHDSRQPSFRREWHTHDCGMLLWPRMGRLKAVWDAAPDDPDTRHAAALVRGTAVLLPASTSHLTASEHARQHHGELYLPPDRMPGGHRMGAMHLDAPTIAMLEALLAPTVTPSSAAWLVRAIVEQLVTSRPLAMPGEPASLARRMLRRFSQALERDLPLPTIDAVAAELGVSIRQLQRACQTECGASPVALRRRVLAAHARAMMAAGRSAASVSVQLGFASSGHLHRLLRDTAGPG
ncbi:AraC family transcriptional regulator [Cupriavidus pauculus]|uniref:AraC family transcriptional regulator n=1 Tax=Cupriavidus pauculus TaxID=82633 RepID=A0A3G8H6D9_9BURK|nr:helix-turn-helix domain-containing protein [Cupriavidus pauculus]AZG15889.1 AraC family transcriptional regulator [Cupriavidus pauculus]